MTELSNKIVENFLVRKSKVQKGNFRRFLIEELTNIGYQPKIEKTKIGYVSTNVIVGNPNKAKIIIGAHYDTQATLGILPNICVANKKWLFYLMQIVLSIVILAIPALIGLAFNAIAGTSACCFSFAVTTFFLLYMMIFGVANPHTYNDNTSGVTTLIEILSKVDPSKRADICVVFFDNEELGLLGSKGFSKEYPSSNQKLVLNFDCVSDGKNILLVYDKLIKEEELAKLKQSFVSNDTFKCIFLSTKKAIYPSDQKSFKQGIGIAALKKKGSALYLDRIHTPKDTIFAKENMEYLSDCTIAYINSL